MSILSTSEATGLLREVGGLPGFLRLDAGNLRALGLTPAKAATVASALELSRRLIRDELPRRPPLKHPEAVARYAAACYRSPDQQIFGALFLDANCRLIADVEIFRGALTAAAVEPRAVFRRALAASAASPLPARPEPREALGSARDSPPGSGWPAAATAAATRSWHSCRVRCRNAGNGADRTRYRAAKS